MQTQKQKQIHIGVSGWHNPRFIGSIYPAGIKASEMLKTYSQYYSTVEVNSSFYRSLTRQQLNRWVSETPEDFIFAVKANRYLTHIKRLICESEEVMGFVDTARQLGHKLGPILFQLPRSVAPTVPELEDFISHLPSGLRYVFEIRQPEYVEAGVIRLLEKHNVGYCVNDFHEDGINYVTADFVYVRLHGPEKLYEGLYSERQLEQWARAVDDWYMDGRDVFVYFNNTKYGEAIENSLRLKKLISTMPVPLPTKTLNTPNEAVLPP